MTRRLVAVGMAIMCAELYAVSVAGAGCIGPVINGECKGQVVEWDTHRPGEHHAQPAPGFYWDYRGTGEQRRHFTEVDPATGFDPHDAQVPVMQPLIPVMPGQ